MSTGTVVNSEGAFHSKTYREFDGYHPLKPFLLVGNATINWAWRTGKRVTLTLHNDLDILHKAIYEFQRLRRGRLSLLSRQPVQSF